MIVSSISFTLYAKFPSADVGRGDLSWILYDPDKVNVTSIATITSDPGFFSGGVAVFPVHVTLPSGYTPGYLHVYFSGDLTIPANDFDSELVDAMLLAIRQLAVQSAPNDTGYQDLILQELGQSNNPVFSLFMVNAWGLWSTLYPANKFIVYLYAKDHGIRYLLGQYWQKYDSKEKDITERESQQFANLLKLLDASEKAVTTFTALTVGFIQPTVGQLTQVFPVEFIGALRSPNSILYRGYPGVTDPNPLLPAV